MTLTERAQGIRSKMVERRGKISQGISDRFDKIVSPGYREGVRNRYREMIPQSISLVKQLELQNLARDVAREMGVADGVFMVAGRRGRMLDNIRPGLKIGDPAPKFRDVARGKLQSVQYNRASTSVFDAGSTARANEDITPKKYGKLEKRIFGKMRVAGGVALFDKDSKKYVGAIAFSGGHSTKVDEELSRRVAERAGYLTDLPSLQPDSIAVESPRSEIDTNTTYSTQTEISTETTPDNNPLQTETQPDKSISRTPAYV